MTNGRPLSELDPGRVCIIKPSSLGDVVHSLPILAALRGRWPKAHLAWVVRSGFRQALEGRRDLDELIVFEVKKTALDPLGALGFARLLARLKRGRFDLAIDLQGLLRSGVMSGATAAPVRVGLADAREGARWFYTHRVDAPRNALHAVERVKRVAAALGAVIDEPRFDPPIADADRAWARDVLAPLARPRLVLNLGARWLTKRWPPEHFAEIGRRAVERNGASLIAVGAHEDRSLVEALTRLLDPVPVLNLSGRTTLARLAALAAEADLFVSNDTGPLHLAAAAGARVVGVYTCTSPTLTGPWGDRAAAVQSKVWCAPGFVKTCDRLECMAELTPDRVWPAVEAALAISGDSRIPPVIHRPEP